MPLLTFEQQQEIKPVSANNEKRYTQIQKEAEEYYLTKLIGAPLLQKIQAAPADYEDLLDGSVFTYCGEQIKHKGLRYVLAYFTFAKYVQEIGITDTFTGFVSKNRSEANDARDGELSIIANGAKSMAYQAFELVKAFICEEYKGARPAQRVTQHWFEGVRRT